MNAVGKVQKWLKFGLSTEQEDRFRKTHFDADISQARIFIFLIILPMAALVINDYSFFGFSPRFNVLLALRLAIVAYTTLFLKSLPRIRNYQSYDRNELVWGLVLALAHIMLNSTRPDDFVAHTIATVLSIFVMVLAIPNKFTNQLILALVYTIGQTLIIVPSMWTLPQASFTVLLNLFIASAVATASSWLLHFWRRQEFLTREEIQKARMETEMQLIERKKAEEALTKIEIARQKEIHHRIKNNLQVISSLLDLESEKFNNKECINKFEILEAFRESQDRVMSIALIHEELHKGEGADTLNFSFYLQRLVKNLFQTYRLGNSDINLKMDLGENIFLDMDTAVPLGIIVNELVSNSLKCAFPERKTGEIQIKLFSEETGNKSHNKEEFTGKSTWYTLVVSDNGIGIPENIDIEKPETLGLQLVGILVDQLDGDMKLDRENGTKFTIRFDNIEK
jgi:two-component sensor histidine kinase